MLHRQLGKALAQIPTAKIDVPHAFEEFLFRIDMSGLQIPEENIKEMFKEWLLFDYKEKDRQTLIHQYYFLNPDKLSPSELNEYKQIIETQSIHLLQVHSVSKSPYIFLQSIFTGKTFKVCDRALSSSAMDQNGSFFGRLAKVGEQYYLVGSNPLFFPIRYTDRAIKIYAKRKMPALSLKDVLKWVSAPQKQKQKNVDIKQEQTRLQKDYERITSQYQTKVPFKKVLELVYEEKYTHNFADYLTDLMRIGVPEEACIEDLEFFQDVWNYFPHKCLGGQCPDELYRKERSRLNK